MAVLLVIVAHYAQPWTAGLLPLGCLGVGLFFTLSGFLITSILLEEVGRSRRVSMRSFYARRAARLFPALAVMIVFTTLLGIATRGELIATALYVSNWYQAATVTPGHLTFTWSLAVEEQFYIAWPFILLALLRLGGRRTLLVGALLGACLSIALRVVLYDGSPASAFQVSRWTFTQMDGLLLGCALAALLPRLRQRESLPIVAAGLILLAITSAIVVPAWQVVVPTIASILGALVIYFAARGTRSEWLGWRPLVLVGQRSYGLYLWHMPVKTILDRAGWSPFITMAVGLLLTWTIAALSWRYVEEPCLRRVRRARETPTGELQGVSVRTTAASA